VVIASRIWILGVPRAPPFVSERVIESGEPRCRCERAAAVDTFAQSAKLASIRNPICVARSAALPSCYPGTSRSARRLAPPVD
jgi:hypothetical protein